MTYEEKLTVWARTLAPEDMRIEDHYVGRVEYNDDSYAGCDTCGWCVTDPSIDIYLGPNFIKSFDFRDMGEILQGLLGV